MSAARADRGWPVTRFPSASMKATTIPTGTSQISVSSEYDVRRTRTRLRASADSSGRSARPRSLGCLPVRHPRVRRDEHARTRKAGAPAEVEVLGAREGRGIEPSELREEVDPDEHRGGGDVEDVTHAVVLLLVELTGLDAGVGNAEPVDRASDLEQHLRIVGAHELRAHDPRVRPVRLLDQDAHGGLTGHDIVVTEQEEGGALDEAQRNVRRRPRSRRSRRAGARRHAAGARRPARWDRRRIRSRRRGRVKSG